MDCHEHLFQDWIPPSQPALATAYLHSTKLMWTDWADDGRADPALAVTVGAVEWGEAVL